MKKNTTTRPAWMMLYATGAVGIVALFVVPFLNLSEDMQTVAFLVITMALWGSAGLWISDNCYALEAEEPSLEGSQLHAKRYYTLNPGSPSSPASTDDHEKEVA
jgi:hypothetical protein